MPKKSKKDRRKDYIYITEDEELSQFNEKLDKLRTNENIKEKKEEQEKLREVLNPFDVKKDK
jgi:hypothetical protein